MSLKTFKLDETGDLIFDNAARPIQLLGTDAVDQVVKAAISLWLGNWYRDLERGVDWLSIFQKRQSRAAIIQILTDALLQVEYVEQVTDIFISVDKETRVAEMTYLIFVNNEKVTGSVVL